MQQQGGHYPQMQQPMMHAALQQAGLGVTQQQQSGITQQLQAGGHAPIALQTAPPAHLAASQHSLQGHAAILPNLLSAFGASDSSTSISSGSSSDSSGSMSTVGQAPSFHSLKDFDAILFDAYVF